MNCAIHGGYFQYGCVECYESDLNEARAFVYAPYLAPLPTSAPTLPFRPATLDTTQVVARLEALLAEAKASEIVGFLAVVQYTGRDTGTYMHSATPGRGNVDELVGALVRATARIVAAQE